MPASLAIAAALGIVLFFWKSRANYLALPSLPVLDNPNSASVTVIIPARDEAQTIARAVLSFPDAAVLVVDDASTDPTAEIAARAGARVIPAPPLPPGTLGKPHACQTGADACSSDWLLFVDADTWFDPRFLPSLLAYADREKLDAASVFPRQHCLTLAEQTLVPYAFALYFTGVDARAVNSPRSPEALGNGQCFLFRRAVYQAIGGHRAVSKLIIEDIALARLLKQNGFRYRVLRAESLAHVRMYASLAAIFRGFEKNAFRFLTVNPITAAQVILASVLATSWLPVLLWAAVDSQWTAAAVLFVSLPAVLLPLYGRRVWLVPAAVYGFQVIALSSLAASLTGRKVIWKGRRV
jgi:cellulose synthase/poly-beta-1,6-N-acetylglucosamine synthase-like glycosyltransferase